MTGPRLESASSPARRGELAHHSLPYLSAFALGGPRELQNVARCAARRRRPCSRLLVARKQRDAAEALRAAARGSSCRCSRNGRAISRTSVRLLNSASASSNSKTAFISFFGAQKDAAEVLGRFADVLADRGREIDLGRDRGRARRRRPERSWSCPFPVAPASIAVDRRATRGNRAARRLAFPEARAVSSFEEQLLEALIERFGEHQILARERAVKELSEVTLPVSRGQPAECSRFSGPTAPRRAIALRSPTSSRKPRRCA